jgi:anthranilate synthase component 1
LLLQCEELAVIDNLSGKLYLIVYADPALPPEAYVTPKVAYAERATQILGQCACGQPLTKPPGERDLPRRTIIAVGARQAAD